MTTDQDTPTTTDADAVEELWLYAGRRYAKGRKVVEAWIPALDGGAPEAWYAADRHTGRYIVGAAYRVRVVRHDGDRAGRMTRYGTPVFDHGMAAPEDLRLEWSARDDAITTQEAIARAERRAVRDGGDPVSDALAPLKAVAAKLRTRADKDAFIARVLRELSEAW